MADIAMENWVSCLAFYVMCFSASVLAKAAKGKIKPCKTRGETGS